MATVSRTGRTLRIDTLWEDWLAIRRQLLTEARRCGFEVTTCRHRDKQTYALTAVSLRVNVSWSVVWNPATETYDRVSGRPWWT